MGARGSSAGDGLDGIFIDFYGTIADGDRAVVEHVCGRLIEECRLDLKAPDLAVRWGERFFAAIATHNGAAFRTLFECECDSLVQTLGPLVGRFDPAPFVEELRTHR